MVSANVPQVGALRAIVWNYSQDYESEGWTFESFRARHFLLESSRTCRSPARVRGLIGIGEPIIRPDRGLNIGTKFT